MIRRPPPGPGFGKNRPAYGLPLSTPRSYVSEMANAHGAGGKKQRCIPKGWLIIAQPFKVGLAVRISKVPKGRLNRLAPEFSRDSSQPSLRDFADFGVGPKVETLGYSHKSLRDKA